MTIDLESLRQTIDRKHAEAVAALETLKGYLTEQQGAASPNGDQATPPLAGGGRIRERVLDAISGGFLTVREIVIKTGLETKQVRGVLTANKLRDSIEKSDRGGTVVYRYLEKPALRKLPKDSE